MLKQPGRRSLLPISENRFAASSEIRSVSFTNRWGGPIGFRRIGYRSSRRHPESADAVVLGGYSGHGVRNRLPRRMGCVEALLKTRMPKWKSPVRSEKPG